ncbi:hypothetical protein SPRG_13745 [Saprolegnia parasitica CBS 223.65]|uniref:Uncharacterized protein n=1 Tax=Saprolegnia parasitica (strain CBS 223.65) TaxID=695850 RepID=A0A067C3Y5_SAPPC|nr:hypothetical protein SPRG_13745 [Saprolegnia parasitica CBS 223.65]KDO21246.1 hypothetical protein SPRG_13745 [Saprolegnia parasitica CBS 223.65]|eukprot:XP_012208077.1 hypothetical protein SPRG_13745 [Saprolegnia parasitica CBS 223.65]
MRNPLPQPSTANDDDELKAVVTADRADYYIVGCGTSWFDLYGFMTAFAAFTVLGTYMTSDARAALWICFFAWAAGVVYLAVTIAIADWETRLKAKVAAEVAADKDALAQVP